MSAIRISRTLQSTTLYLPELEPLIGKHVELTVREASDKIGLDSGAVGWVNPLRGSIIRDDDPFAPAVEPDDWEANR